MKKILFLDVDGTLVDYENHLPKSAVEAIRRTRELGNLVFICTGRSRAEVYEDIWDIGIDGMIGGNGSYVEYQNQVVIHQKITEEECREIVDWLHERNLEFYLESNNGLFASEKFETEALPAIRAYSAQKGRDATHLTARDVFPEMIFDGELYRDDLNKLCIKNISGSYRCHGTLSKSSAWNMGWRRRKSTIWRYGGKKYNEGPCHRCIVAIHWCNKRTNHCVW